MLTIFLSPHLDDAVYSCGGWIWELIQQGRDVSVWTIFAGDESARLTPFARILHHRWKLGRNPIAGRREEDMSACKLLRCSWLHFDFQDCIYRVIPSTRKPLIREATDLFLPFHSEEEFVIDEIAQKLKDQIPQQAEIVVPLAVGGHMDHRITLASAQRTGMRLSYYVDFPYAANHVDDVQSAIPPGVNFISTNLSREGIAQWINAVGIYKSQISSFWSSKEQMDAVVKSYAQGLGGYAWR